MLRPSRVLLIALLSLLLPAAAALAAPADTGRYYVVGPPVHGQPDYLYAIAVATLHNGNRYQEIFRLNQGRAQPDGGRLTDPAEVLHPGWVLALPKDARGPRVLTGPLPLDGPSSSPVAAPPPAPVSTRPAANGEPLLTYGGLTLAVLLVGFAVVVLRRRPSETSALAVPVATGWVRSGPPALAPPRMPAPARGRNSGPAPKSDLAGTADAGPGPTAYARPGAAAAGPSAAPGTAYAGPGAAAVGSSTAADGSVAASHAGLGTTAHAGPRPPSISSSGPIRSADRRRASR